MRTTETSARFGNKLLAEREKAGVSTTHLAKEVGVSLSTLSRIEAGSLSPSRDLAERIAGAFEQPVEGWFLAAGIVPERVAALLAESPDTFEAVSRIAPPAVVARARLEGLIADIRNRHPALARMDGLRASRLCLLKTCTELLPSADWSSLSSDSLDALRSLPDIIPSSERADLLAGVLDELAGLGPLYEAIVPQRQRQTMGQFYTPPDVAALMASFIPDGAETVLDPAVGAGVLLAAVNGKAALVGYDIDELAIAMATVNLRGRGLKFGGFTCDFLADQGGLFPEPSHGPKTYDAIICNPPYMRHHLLTKEQKERLASHHSKALGVSVSGLSTNYAYFFMEAIQRLSDGGTLVFITPSEFLDVGYGEAIKAALLKHARLDELLFFDRTATAFAGVMTTSCITIATKKKPQAKHRVTLSLAAEDGRARKRHKEVLQSALKPDDKWTLLFNGGQRQLEELSQNRPLRLTDYVRIRRGIATGMNGYFTLTDEEVGQHGLPDKYLVPVITSAKDLPSDVLDKHAFDGLRRRGRKCWLFHCFDPLSKITDNATRAYIKLGEKQGVPERYLCQSRNPWYAVEKVEPPDIIVTYMTRTGPRFAANRAGCRVMSVFLNLYVIRQDVNIAQLVQLLNSDETRQLLKLLGRVYSGGLGKIEPGELAKLPMPEPSGLHG